MKLSDIYHCTTNKPLTKQNFSLKEKTRNIFFIRSVGFFIKYSIKKLPNPPDKEFLRVALTIR